MVHTEVCPLVHSSIISTHLWYIGSRRLTHRSLHNGGLHIQVLKVLLELVHEPGDLLQIHALHGRVHGLNHARHGGRHALGGHRGLDSVENGIK